LSDFLDALRHLILGYSAEEKAAIQENLKKAQENVEANKARNDGEYDYSENLVEMVTGIPGELQNANIFLYGIVAIIVVLLLKD
jgi:hypothetical protein